MQLLEFPNNISEKAQTKIKIQMQDKFFKCILSYAKWKIMDAI